jgi:phage shock protein PspC (stress-responsive transcriptional regulator)
MHVMFVIIHSVGSLKLRDTSLYIVASVLMPVMFVKTFIQKSEIKRNQVIHSGQSPYACNCFKKHSVGYPILQNISLYIVASVLIPETFLKKRSLGSLILKSPGYTKWPESLCL